MGMRAWVGEAVGVASDRCPRCRARTVCEWDGSQWCPMCGTQPSLRERTRTEAARREIEEHGRDLRRSRGGAS